MNSEFASYTDSNLFEYAKQLYDQDQLDRSFSAYSELARRGYGGCYVFLGWMCYEGKGTVQNELTALEWFKKAADVGSAQGRYYSARLLEKMGQRNESLSYLRAAVSQNYGPALCRLGRMLLEGRNIPVDAPRALRLLTQSASLGNVFAKRELARVQMKESNSPIRWTQGLLKLIWAAVEGELISLTNPRSERIQT
jgi:TPR repeat protein